MICTLALKDLLRLGFLWQPIVKLVFAHFLSVVPVDADLPGVELVLYDAIITEEISFMENRNPFVISYWKLRSIIDVDPCAVTFIVRFVNVQMSIAAASPALGSPIDLAGPLARGLLLAHQLLFGASRFEHI